MKFNHLKIIFLIFGAFSMALFSACGSDEEPMGTEEIRGCTDSSADNYNPNANVNDGSCVFSGCTDDRAENYDANASNDDGSCVYPNEKFISAYLGSFACEGLFSVINQDTVEFEITEPVDPEEKSKVTVSFIVTGIPISLDAEVDGNTLDLGEISLMNIPFEFGGAMIEADITFTGSATIDGDMLTADLMVSADAAGLTLVDNCSLIGTKID